MHVHEVSGSIQARVGPKSAIWIILIKTFIFLVAGWSQKVGGGISPCLGKDVKP